MKIINTNPTAASLNYLKGQILTRLKLRSHHSGSTAYSLRSESFIEYARQVVGDYITYGADGRMDRLEGTSIVEIGPGDNLGVALLLLANGAGSVTCVDGFSPRANDVQNRSIYKLLHVSLTEKQRSNLSMSVDISSDGNLTIKNDRLKVYYNTPVEGLSRVVGQGNTDIVISRAVLEHVYSPQTAWKQMVSCLSQDGEMWHKIDFRSHKFYNEIHPLYFLTVPDFIWNFISSPDPTLNRERMPFYRDATSGSFSHVKVYATHILENKEIIPHVLLEDVDGYITPDDEHCLRDIQRRLPAGLKSVDRKDLLISGVFIICKGLIRTGAPA